jgi:enoyl-CoA hydratase/carnithine racemase
MSRYWQREQRGAIVTLSFARPPINMLSFLALAELDAELAAIAGDSTAAVVVLTGALPGYFVAHADLDDVGRMARREPPQGDPAIYRSALRRLESLPQPTVAAVNGQAWGGGCELALACTFRLVARSGHFCLLEVSKGAIPGGGGTARLPRLVGVARAARMILSSCVVRADEACTIGLADALFADAGFLDAVAAWLAPIAAQPRHALFAAKRALLEGLQLPFDAALDNEQRLFVAAVTSAEFVEEPR